MLIQPKISRALRIFALGSPGGVTPPRVRGATLGGTRAIGYIMHLDIIIGVHCVKHVTYVLTWSCLA